MYHSNPKLARHLKINSYIPSIKFLKNHQIILIDAEKASDKIQLPCVIKILKQMTEQNFLDLIKGICKNHTANFILNCERLGLFLLRSEARQGSMLLPFLFNIILEVLFRAIKVGKINKRVPD